MDNFQLYRTNVLLGGQMKWDLILDSMGSNLIVKDFHLSPICKDVPYNRYSQNSLINYPHQENVKKYYNEISSSFYEDYIDSNLESLQPIYSEQYMDTHCGDFEMGCRRALYGVYKKQFEFFCPLWLEKLNVNDELEFELVVCSSENKELLKKSLIFKIKQPLLTKRRVTTATPEQAYHNDFVNYFNEYISYKGVGILNTGNDNLLNIDLANATARAWGLNVKTGIYDKNGIDISLATVDLISREQPLLVFDNIITNQLKQNNLIAPQLFNFNLCFDPEDIIPPFFMNMMIGKTLNFKLRVYINGVQLKLRDFYTNFEYIPRKFVGPVNYEGMKNKTVEAPNVLEYLKDYKCIDLIDKNKILQNTIHWSLADNNDYIFNIYDGFKGYSLDDNGTPVNHDRLYDNAPDINCSNYNKYSNGLGWCNYLLIDNNMKDGKITQGQFWNNVDDYVKYASNFSADATWVNKIKYGKVTGYDKLNVLIIENNTNVLLDPISYDRNMSIKCMNVYARMLAGVVITVKHDDRTENEPLFDLNANMPTFTYKANLQIMLYDNNTLIFVVGSDDKSKKLMLFKNIYKILSKLYNDELRTKKHVFREPIRALLSKMSKADNLNNPPTVSALSTLDIVKPNGPSQSISEISYITSEQRGSIVSRYFGKIKPTFVEDNDINFNYLYYKECFTDKKSFVESKYPIYFKTVFDPKYPSLNYFPIKKEIMDYDNLPKIPNILHPYEYHWFNMNSNIILTQELNTELKSKFDDNGDYIKLEKLIKEYLMEYYHLNEDCIDYIYTLYNIESSFEYASPTNIVDYVYTVKLNLK